MPDTPSLMFLVNRLRDSMPDPSSLISLINRLRDNMPDPPSLILLLAPEAHSLSPQILSAITLISAIDISLHALHIYQAVQQCRQARRCIRLHILALRIVLAILSTASLTWLITAVVCAYFDGIPPYRAAVFAVKAFIAWGFIYTQHTYWAVWYRRRPSMTPDPLPRREVRPRMLPADEMQELIQRARDEAGVQDWKSLTKWL